VQALGWASSSVQTLLLQTKKHKTHKSAPPNVAAAQRGEIMSVADALFDFKKANNLSTSGPVWKAPSTNNRGPTNPKIIRIAFMSAKSPNDPAQGWRAKCARYATET